MSNGGRIRGGLYWPNGGYVTDPALSSQNLADAARQHGAAFRLGVEVVEILQEGGRVKGVRLADGEEIHAPVVINVAGPGSAHINGLAGVLDDMTIETRPLRQEVAHVPAPAGFDFEQDGMVVSDSDIACYIRPEHGNNILIGSEDPPCDPHMWSETDTAYEREFTDQWNTQVMRYAQRVPSLGIPSQTRGVVDLYDASTDWIPIYDKAALGGYYMACGTSGNQYKNAPIAGKMMAALIDYCEGGADHDSTPLQYRLPYIGHDIDVGFYSRKRQINDESSFSVLG
jgi:sarcosine oxidase subunit beta